MWSNEETGADREWFIQRLFAWGEENYRDLPWRVNRTPYRILVAEVLLTQTPASRVANIYPEFISKYPDLSTLADASIEQLRSDVEPLGFQNRRARALRAIGQQRMHDGIPSNERELRELPYVGRYAANAILCFGFEQAIPVVDRNVVRIYDRVFGLDIGDAEKDEAWEFAARLLPEKRVLRYNFLLLDFGAFVCQKITPRCGDCVMNDRCSYERGGRF